MRYLCLLWILLGRESIPDVQVEFKSAPDGGPNSVTTFTTSGEYSYDLVNVELPTKEDLKVYKGKYYSPELDLYWKIILNEGTLLIHRRKYVDSQLTPLLRDVFSDDWSPIVGYPLSYTLIFGRDRQGQIDCLKVSGSRVRNLKFRKCFES